MAYHKIDRDSVSSITSALDIFAVPPTNVSVSSAKVFEILPSNPLTDRPYHFKIHASSNYIDLTKCYVLTEFRIRKEVNGQWVVLEATDNVAPIQMLGLTFINNMRVCISGREVFNSNALMAYKSYMSHELSMSPTAKQSHLEAAGYYWQDNTGRIELEQGTDFDKRKALFAGGATVQFMAKLDADLFNQPHYLLNHTEVDIEILPHDSSFTLIAPDLGHPTYRLEATKCKLYVKKVELMDGLALDIARKLDMRPARYAVRKTMMKSMFISQNRYDFDANIFNDQIPRRITLGLVANTDFVGNMSRSPFNFGHHHVREISIIANGRAYPQAIYELDYANSKYARAFNDMNEAIGFINSLEGNGITYARYAATHCMYSFNLTSSGDDHGGLFDLIKNGSTAVSIRFAQPTPDGGLALVVMAEADSLVLMDKNRSIATDSTI